MTSYHITKEIRISKTDEYGFCLSFSADEYGTVGISDSTSATRQVIHIPKDCIQHVIDVLEQFK